MRAIYAFSGDPVTYGHLDIVQRAANTYREVVVAIGENPSKSGKYLFSAEERLALARYCSQTLPNVQCTAFQGLLGEYAYRNGFDVIVRGVRNNSDLEGELAQFGVIESLHPKVDTVFFPTRRSLSHISSSIAKAIVGEGGDVSAYCPLVVKEVLERRLLNRLTIGIAGGIAAGKTLVSQRLIEALGNRIPATYVSLDAMGHYVLAATPEQIFRDTRRRIVEQFGKEVERPDGSIDRRLLGRLVFRDQAALTTLNRLMHEPMLARLYEETRSTRTGILILEGAILVEACWSSLVNNNVLLVDAPSDVRLRRLVSRGSEPDEAAAKINRQISARERYEIMRQRLIEQRWGRLWQIENSGDEAELQRRLGSIADKLVELYHANTVQQNLARMHLEAPATPGIGIPGVRYSRL